MKIIGNLIALLLTPVIAILIVISVSLQVISLVIVGLIPIKRANDIWNINLKIYKLLIDKMSHYD